MGTHSISNPDTHLYLAHNNSSVNLMTAAEVWCWVHHHWNAERLEASTRLCAIISDIETHPLGLALPRTASVQISTPYTNGV